MLRLILLAILLILATPLTHAGTYNDKLNLGDPAPAWLDLPGADGKKHSLSDLKDKEVVVVVFTCNSCPVAVDYEDRIIAFAKAHATPGAKVGLVAINVNTIPEDLLPRMKERAETKGFTFPYLFDETQKVAKDYGALYTPEFFVLGKDRRIAYMGAMDDKSKPSEVKVKHLESAVQAVLAGNKPAVGETLARGCLIRYKRERK